MFSGGSDTASSTIEWAMAELLRNPDSMRKVKEEINSVVGLHGKFEEKNMDKLPYLQAVGKENLRLHPALSLLLPRNAMHDSSYRGYQIPKNTQVLVNAWAIRRDRVLGEPLVFQARELSEQENWLQRATVRVRPFEFIPFGSGRRMCIGFALAQQVVHLALASLIHSFDWEVSSPTTEIDMTERAGMGLRKLVPLKANTHKAKFHTSDHLGFKNYCQVHGKNSMHFLWFVG